MDKLRHSNAYFALLSIVLGAIAWYASFELAIEYIRKLKNPDYVPNCEFSILVTCAPNMQSWQGSIFGFSNTIIGIAVFIIPIVIGAALLAKARFNALFWLLYSLGLLAGLVFIFWLSWQSVFRIGTLCPWCMVIWACMIPLFWFTVPRVLAFYTVKKTTKIYNLLKSLHEWRWITTIASYAIIAFYAQLGVDWVSHLMLAFK